MKRKGNAKKILTFSVTLAMMLSLFPLQVFAAEEMEESVIEYEAAEIESESEEAYAEFAAEQTKDEVMLWDEEITETELLEEHLQFYADEGAYAGTITVPEGIEDGVYNGTATVGNYDYSITVYVSVNSGAITGITVEGAEGRNASYSEDAREGIESQILSGKSDINSVSGATYSSAAIIEAVNDALANAGTEEPDDGTTVISLSTSTPAYSPSGTSFDVIITNPSEDADYSDVVLSYEAGRNTGTLTLGSDFSVAVSEESDSRLVYTVTVLNEEYNTVGWSLNVAVAGEDLGSITIISGATFSIVDNTLVVSGGNGETIADYISNASSITLIYTDQSGQEVTVTESLQPFHSEAPNYYGSDIFNEDGSINFACSIFALGASGSYQMTVSSDGFNDVSATVGGEEDTGAGSDSYSITIPEGLADGTYSASGIYVDHDNDAADAEAFTNYPISVDVVIENGAIVSITVSGASGNNTQYSYRAETGISEQIVGNGAGTYNVDTVSTATCSSVAIIEAVNAALQNEASDIRMSLSDAIYHKDGTSFTLTIENPDPSVDYSDISLSYAVGKFSNTLVFGEDFTVSEAVESDDGSLEFTITIQNSEFNVNDDDHDQDDMNYNSVGMAIDVAVGETTVGRIIITSGATLTIENNRLTMTGGYGETLQDYLDVAGTITLTYENEVGETVTESYDLQWAHDVYPDYTPYDFFNEDGSVNFDIAPFVYGADWTYTITISAEGYADVTGVVGAVSSDEKPETEESETEREISLEIEADKDTYTIGESITISGSVYDSEAEADSYAGKNVSLYFDGELLSSQSLGDGTEPLSVLSATSGKTFSFSVDSSVLPIGYNILTAEYDGTDVSATVGITVQETAAASSDTDDSIDGDSDTLAGLGTGSADNEGTEENEQEDSSTDTASLAGVGSGSSSTGSSGSAGSSSSGSSGSAGSSAASGGSAASAKTGDETPIALYLSVMLLAAGALGSALLYRRRRSR